MWHGSTVLHPANRHYEAMQQEVHELQEECKMLKEQNSDLKARVNNFLRNETLLKSRFKRIQSETAPLSQTTCDTIGMNVDRNSHVPIYREVVDYLQHLSHDNIRLKENLRRVREILAQTEDEASTAAAHYQEVTSEMMAKLNSLQTRSETLHDDQCASEWRKLQQALNVWTRRTFMDKSALSRMTLRGLQQRYPSLMAPEDMFQSVQGKRAYIQGIIANEIFNTVFNRCFASSPSARSERFLAVIGNNVRKSGNSYTWETWRSATSRALDDRAAFSSHRLDNVCNQISQMIDTIFGDYYSAKVQKGYVYEEIYQIFKDCLAFKKRLERQESEYIIQQSQSEAVFVAQRMKTLSFIEGEGSMVQMSVWPSLHKLSFDDEVVLIEPEVVWTKKPNQSDDSSMENFYGIEKEIKQEVKAEDDDDEVALVVR